MSGMGMTAPAAPKPRTWTLFSLLATLALLALPAAATAECTVHGYVYDWSTFNTINSAVVEVNSVPVQRMLTSAGSYSFSLPKGTYTLTARAGVPGTQSELVVVENITIPESGDYVIDLILFPPSTFEDLSGFDDTNLTPTIPPDDGQPALPWQQNWIVYLGAGAIILAIIAMAVAIIFLRMVRPPAPPEMPAKRDEAARLEKPVLPEQPSTTQPPPISETPTPQPQPSAQELLLPQDCREALAIIEKNDGRITQLDLRKALPYSEAKVSLIVSDLESRGLIKKIKKGRGNVLIVNRPGERPPEK